jgi:hypothetical protein
MVTNGNKSKWKFYSLDAFLENYPLRELLEFIVTLRSGNLTSGQ